LKVHGRSKAIGAVNKPALLTSLYGETWKSSCQCYCTMLCLGHVCLEIISLLVPGFDVKPQPATEVGRRSHGKGKLPNHTCTAATFEKFKILAHNYLHLMW